HRRSGPSPPRRQDQYRRGAPCRPWWVRTCRHRRRGRSSLASVEISHYALLEAEHPPAARKRHEAHLARLAGLEAHRGAGGNVEPASAGDVAVELQGLVGLGEVVVGADLDRPVAGVGDRQRHGLAAGVDLDVAWSRDDLAGDHGLSPHTTANARPAAATSAPAPRTARRPVAPFARWATPRPMACSRAVAIAKPAAYVAAAASAGSSAPCAWPCSRAKAAINAAPSATGSRAAVSTSSPSTITEARMPGSTRGTGMPPMPSAPPISITPTKAAGHAHRARPPLRPAQSPTATIASMWSSPVHGWAKPEANDTACSSPVWAWAAPAAPIDTATAANAVFKLHIGLRSDIACS